VTEDGGNIEIAPPTIAAVDPVQGTACANCIVDIYSDSANEGQVYEGSTIADADGAFACRPGEATARQCTVGRPRAKVGGVRPQCAPFRRDPIGIT
jgi:hypothetical protein